jgi:Tol biopolymer transport system component/tRNA A-37 threonylcarbamoyl transferase component Bud32
MEQVLSLGSVVSGYRIDGVLGRGGMGMVYHAWDTQLDRKAVVKVLAPEWTEDEAFRTRFRRESHLAAAIDHPNIVPVYGAGETNGVLWIAMRYVEGTDLRRLLDQERQLDLDRTISIIAQVGRALDTAHGRGLVHRDVKPGNILVVPGGGPDDTDHVYLTDFGLTKQTDSRSALTSSKDFVGTVAYSAPEQIEGKPVDGRTDIYALGCVFFECLTGEVPFPREDEVAAMFAHISAPPPSLIEKRPSLPPGLDTVIQHALGKQKDARYPTAQAMVASIRTVIAEAKQNAEEDERKRREEEEARRRAEEEARRREEEEARRRAEEEARRREEEEARRREEEEARRREQETPKPDLDKTKKADRESRRRAQEEARRQREEQARLEAEEEAKRRTEQAEATEGRDESRRRKLPRNRWMWIAGASVAAVVVVALILTQALPNKESNDAARSGEVGGGPPAHVFLINPDGSGLSAITKGSSHDIEPAWDPSELTPAGQLAFASDRDSQDGKFDIYIMDGYGTGLRNVTRNPASDVEPAWSSDGARVAFVSDRTGDRDIFVMNADGTGLRNLTHTPGSDEFDPSWSSVGRIAFARDSDQNGRTDAISLMNDDGSGLRDLAGGVDDAAKPRWSSDGSQIAFSSGGDIWVMNNDGTGRESITDRLQFPATDPTWEPDGTRVAFAGKVNGNYDIFVMNIRGEGLRNLTNSPEDERDPAWRPAGIALAFDREAG